MQIRWKTDNFYFTIDFPLTIFRLQGTTDKLEIAVDAHTRAEIVHDKIALVNIQLTLLLNIDVPNGVYVNVTTRFALQREWLHNDELGNSNTELHVA